MNKPDTALVSAIQHFSIDDGAGIRTTVFLQGCPLKCKWCHNPEATVNSPVLFVSNGLCTLCGLCRSVCENGVHIINYLHTLDLSKCTFCGMCAKACENNAITLSGTEMTVGEVFEEVISDREFYKDGGGLTLSGGEPLVQSEFCVKLLTKCRDSGVNTAVQTSGNVDYSRLQSVIPLVDRFFYDIKGVDADEMKKATGADYDTVYGNLSRLIKQGANVTAAIPVIPGYSDSTEYMKKAALLLIKCGVGSVRLLPFHRFGFSKYEGMGIVNECLGLKPPGRETMMRLASVFPDDIKVTIK